MTLPCFRHRRGRAITQLLNGLGIILVIVALGVSLVRVLSIQEALYDPDKTVIRISHWQLELGYRQAMQEIIDDYEALHPGVTVKQIAVTEKIYGQWVNTHLNAGTAPDLVLIGYGKLASDPQYVARFFVPLTEQANQPNPYNADNDMAAWPWRETFVDGMRVSYVPELQDYFSAPNYINTLRMYYNRDLVHTITGSGAAPRTMGELLKICRQVRAYAERTGQADRLVPIASSRYNLNPVINAYRVPFTASLEPYLDVNFDGIVENWEIYTGFVKGTIGYDQANIHAYYDCLRALCDHFNPGFMSMGREDSTFMFVQQNAVMMCTGSWDANSLFVQAEFDVGVFDFPLPAAGEQWSDLVAGRRNEASVGAGGRLGINKQSRHFDQAIDFLHFLTSREYNQKLSRLAGWLPAIVGATPSETMTPFQPDPEGFATGIELSYGLHANAVLGGQEWKFFSGETDYAALAQAVEAALRDPRLGGDKAWADEFDVVRRWCRNQDRVLTVQMLRVFTEADGRMAKDNHRRTLLQQMRKNNGQELRHRFESLRGVPIETLVD